MSDQSKPASQDAFKAASSPASAPNTDAYGRNTTGWIEVNGKARPHP